MKLARVIGTVTLARAHPALTGCRLRCVEAVESIDQVDKDPIGTETQVAWDLLGTGEGENVALAEGPEAAAPFRPAVVPIDASIVAILDHIET